MRIFLSITVLLLLQSCKHPLAIEGEGDIVERLVGQRGCTLEEFQANSPRCTENNVVDEDYIVSYEAVPRPGWRFVTWRAGTACSPNSVAPYCEYNVIKELVVFADETWPDLALPATVAVFGQPNTWTTRADMPTARLGLASCTVNGKIYAMGGYAAANAPGLTTVEEYDPASDTWSSRSPMPTSRVLLASETVGGNIFAFGGLSIQDYNDELEQYDPISDSWFIGAPLPTSRLGLTGSALSGKIYAIGGDGGILLQTVEEYGPQTNTWSAKSPMPRAREQHTSSVVNGAIYVIGGRAESSGIEVDISLVEKYIPTHDTLP